MRRSYRKTAGCGMTTAVSEKQDKRNANRKIRRINNEQVNRNQDNIEPKSRIVGIWGKTVKCILM